MYCPVKNRTFVAPEKSSFCPLCGQAIDSAGKHISTPKPERELYCPFTKQGFTVDIVPSICPKCRKSINTITGQHIETPPPPPPLRVIYCPNKKLSFNVDKIPSICPLCGKTINVTTGEHYTPARDNGDFEKKFMGFLTILFVIGCFIVLIFVDGEAKLAGIPLGGAATLAYNQYKNSYGKL